MSRPAVAAEPGSGKIDLLYNPYQQAALEALAARTPKGQRAYTRLSLFAGRRGGKTLIGALGTVLEARRADNQTIWVCSGSYPKLHDYVIPAVAKYLPKSWLSKAFSASHYEWTLTNGTLIQARSLDDINRARGPGLDLAWIDEARDVAPLAWKTMVPALVDKRGTAIITTTPAGFDYWYETFWLPAAEQVPGYWSCRYKTMENPWIRDNCSEEIAAAKREMDPLFFQQEFEAEFVSFTGSIYGDVLAKQLLTDEAAIRRFLPEWPRVDSSRPIIVGLDPGADHPFGAVVIVGTEHGLLAISEYLTRDASTMRHAQSLRALLHRNGIAAPNTWAIDRSQKQTAIELAQHGIFVTAAENDVVAGIQRVKSWMFSGRLFIIKERCPKLVQQLFSYRWAENIDSTGQARREKVVKMNDDLCDSLRYAIMTWPELPYAPEPSQLRSLDLVADEYRWAMEREQRCVHPELFEEEDAENLDIPGLLTEDSGNPVGEFWN